MLMQGAKTKIRFDFSSGELNLESSGCSPADGLSDWEHKQKAASVPVKKVEIRDQFSEEVIAEALSRVDFRSWTLFP